MRALAPRLAWRWFRRDLAAGEVRVLLAALALAVAAIATVGFLTDRAERALALEANRLLGGDAALRSDTPIAPGLRALAAREGLAQAEVWSLRSMLRAGTRLRLGEIRALGFGYPLRGRFRLDAGAGPRPTDAVPARGTLWLSDEAARELAVARGGTVRIGTLALSVAAVVAEEPDAALDYFNLAPRVFMNLADLPASGLVQEGSRIGYRLVVRGAPAAVERYVAATRAELGRGQRLETIAEARPELRRALDRAGRFFALAAMIAVALAAVAVALAARRYAERHLDGCALMRCLGASQRTIVAITLGELLLVGGAGIAIGLAAAAGLQALAADRLAATLGIVLPPLATAPAGFGAAVGLTVLLAFAAPPVLALARVPTLRVLRRDLGAVSLGARATGGLALAALAALSYAVAGDATLGGVALGGLAAALLVLGVLGALLVAGLRRVRARLRGPLRYGLASVTRHARLSIAQIAALGLGLTAIALLVLVRSDLLEAWRRSLPADAPNRFVINVQREQVAPLAAAFAAAGLDAPALAPMVRARLVRVNDAPVALERYADERARRLAEREFNLSWATALGADNRVVAGRFWDANARAVDELSVEEGIAQALGWTLGDRIEFEIAGRPYAATITSLRRVEWDSFRPNFFVLAAPGALDAYAASWIGSVHVQTTRAAALGPIVERFPNVSIIDVGALLERVQGVAEQAARVVETVFLFTLAAGVLVLIAAVGASQDERLLDAAVMRALGARRRQLALALLAEFVALGLVAGLTAASAASALSATLATRVFELPWRLNVPLALGVTLAGVVLVTLAGLVAARRVVTTPPATTLRRLSGA
jgi:putative ABC transport system permease protein